MRLEDAKQRWDGTIVRINGCPAMIEAVMGVGRKKDSFVTDFFLAADGVWAPHQEEVAISDIDETIPNLGTLQRGERTQYLMRRASHQFKRGLVLRQIRKLNIGNAPHIPDQHFDVGLDNYDTLYQIYNPTYPSMMQAYNAVLRGEVYSMCFSQLLTLAAGASRWPILYYAIYPVARVKPDVIELASTAAMLREAIAEVVPFPVVIK